MGLRKLISVLRPGGSVLLEELADREINPPGKLLRTYTAMMKAHDRQWSGLALRQTNRRAPACREVSRRFVKRPSLHVDRAILCGLIGSERKWPDFAMLGRWLKLAYCASTSVTFEPARHTASILFEPLGCWGCRRMGAKSGGEKLRKSGVACENPLLDRKQPSSLSEHSHIRFKFY